MASLQDLPVEDGNLESNHLRIRLLMGKWNDTGYCICFC